MHTENQGSSSLSYPKRNNQRESTRQKSEISLANSVRGTSSLASRPLPWSVPPITPSMSSSLDWSSSLPATDCRKGKLRAHDSYEFDVLPSSTPKTPKLHNKSSCNQKKDRVKQVYSSDSEDETEVASITVSRSSSLENSLNRVPKRRRLSTDPAAQ